MSDWIKLVKKTYEENKHKKGYEYKNAMFDAKKLYKNKPVRTVRNAVRSVAETVGDYVDEKVFHTKEKATRRRKARTNRRKRPHSK